MDSRANVGSRTPHARNVIVLALRFCSGDAGARKSWLAPTQSTGIVGLQLFGIVTFFIFGIALTLVGSNQADLARDLDLSLSQTGMLLAALGLGVIFGAPSAGAWIDRGFRKPVFCFAFLLMALSLLTIEAKMSFWRAFTQIGVSGFAAGMYSTALNTVVSERRSTSPARALMLLHSSVTIGAMLGPIWVQAITQLETVGRWPLTFQLIGALHLALAVGVLFLEIPAPVHHEKGLPALPQAPLQKLHPVFFLAGIGFAYIGLEAAVMGFAVPYATDALGLAAQHGQWSISTYWLGIFLARVLGSSMKRMPQDGFLLGAGIFGMLTVAFFTFTLRPEIEWFTGLLGFSIGAVYPFVLSLVGNRFPEARARNIGIVIAIGSVGGTAIPCWTGLLGDYAGMRIAMFSMVIWCGMISAIALALMGRIRQEN